MSKHYRILSINGGGVRGLVPAKIIDKIVSISKKPIHHLFDYIVGTSAGGMIAISLTVKDELGNPKFTTKDIVNIFKNEAKRIFPPSYLDAFPALRNTMQLFASKHSRQGIDLLLEEKLGNTTLLNTTIPITAISYSLDYDGPRLWSTYRAQNAPDSHNYFLKDAAGATSAAPTYFPAKVTISPDGRMFHDIDGGIFANSPTMIGISEFLSQNERKSSDKLTVISIGTGRFKEEPLETFSTYPLPDLLKTPMVGFGFSILTCLPYFMSYVAAPFCVAGTSIGTGIELYNAYYNEGGIDWLARGALIDRIMKGSEISDAFQAKMVETVRINPELDTRFKSMDDSSDSHIRTFDKAIDTFIRKHEIVLSKISDCLTANEDKLCNEARTHASQFGEDFFATKLSGVDVSDFTFE